MKVRNKGKVHPFISSTASSSSSHSPKKDDFPVLRLLPAAIFTLVSVLSLDDREVLAYMITRSLKSTNNPSFIHKKLSFGTSYAHKSPALFDCECFSCYTSFWFRWDSSPNRELIHQAIEEFEEHLNNGELSMNGASGKNKKKEKMGRRKSEKTSAGCRVLEDPSVVLPENQESLVLDPPDSGVGTGVEEVGGGVDEAEMGGVAAPVVAVHSHKGLARKVLPDVIGIFNSRLWSLWNPNV